MPKLLPALLLFQLAVAQGSQDWLQRGQQDYAARRYADAVSSLSMAVSKDPSNDIAHYLLGNALLRIGHTEHALQEYQRAYATTGSPEIDTNCRQVLRTYHMQLPAKESRVKSSWRQTLPGVGVRSLNEITSAAEQRVSQSAGATDSHPDGIPVFKTVPEFSGGTGASWNRWIEDFRWNFESIFARELGRRREAAWGKTKMVFSVDAQHKLRGRIVATDAPRFFNDGLLATTRRLDGNRVLSFPPSTAVAGFNFTMGWDYGAHTKAKEDVFASLNQTRAGIRNVGADRAVAGKLSADNAGGKLLNKPGSGNVSGKLVDAAGEKASGKLLDQHGSGALAGSLMPTFSTDLSGIILPKARPTELKAQPAKSLEDVKTK